MSPLLIAGIVLAYVLLSRPISERAATLSPIPATARATPGATTITIPGVGTYQNVYGQGVSIAFNPALFAGLFNRPTPEPDLLAGTAPVLAGPELGYGNVPELAITGGYTPSDLAVPITIPEAII